MRFARMKRGPSDGPDQATIDELTRLLRAGAFLETAAAAIDVTSATLRNWLRYARKGDTRYQPVARAIQQALAEFETRTQECVTAAAEGGDWKAAAWLLEKRFPKRWGAMAQGGDDDLDDEARALVVHLAPVKTEATS